MTVIKECQVSCSCKSELVSQSLEYDDMEEQDEPPKKIMITLDHQPAISFLMLFPPQEDSTEGETDESKWTQSLNSSKLMIENFQTSYESESQDYGQPGFFESLWLQRDRAIEKFKSLLQEWQDPVIGDYVAVIIGEELKKYGQVIEKNEKGCYNVYLGEDKPLLSLKENRLVPLSHLTDRIDHFKNNLGQLLDSKDLDTLPPITRPHIYRPEVESKRKQRAKFPNRVVEKPSRCKSEVLVALNKGLVVEGIIHDICTLSILRKKQERDLEPEYSGTLYSVVYTNPDTGQEQLGYFTIYRIRMKSDLLDEESDEI